MSKNPNIHECIVLKDKHESYGNISYMTVYDYNTDRIINTALFDSGFRFDKEDTIYKSKIIYVVFCNGTDTVKIIYDDDDIDNENTNLLYAM